MRNDGSSTLGESESVTLSGPTEPATKRFGPSAAASRAIRAPSTFMLVDRVLEPVVGLADRGRRERVRGRDVGAGVEVARGAISETISGCVRLRRSGSPLTSRVVVAEPLAAVVLLAEPAPLEQHAPGAVEHDDPLVEQRSQSRLGLRSSGTSVIAQRGPVRTAPTGSLGVFYPVAKLPFKALQVAGEPSSGGGLLAAVRRRPELVLGVLDPLLELPAVGGRLARVDALELRRRLLELALRARRRRSRSPRRRRRRARSPGRSRP